MILDISTCASVNKFPAITTLVADKEASVIWAMRAAFNGREQFYPMCASESAEISGPDLMDWHTMACEQTSGPSARGYITDFKGL